MWILPKQLHTLACALDMEALSLDLSESSQICAQSLFVRSKPLPARTWFQKWKRDSWTQHLFGRILKPSLGEHFVTAWTSSLEVIRASHSAQLDSDEERTTRGTCGRGLQMEFDLCAQDSASLKTSKDISAWGCPTSSKTWSEWVTELRGEYSARLKSALLTKESEYSSWPTATARDWKDGSLEACKNVPANGLLGRFVHGQPALGNNSTSGNRLESWLTPRANESDSDPNFAARNADRGAHCHGTLSSQIQTWATPTVAETHNQGSSSQIYLQNQVGATQKQWATPRAEHDSGMHNGKPDTLHSQMKQWGTPTARDHKSGRGNEEQEYKELTPMVERTQTGRLNPRWVETLMGLPVGWTMPSCVSPATIEPMNCGSSETA